MNRVRALIRSLALALLAFAGPAEGVRMAAGLPNPPQTAEPCPCGCGADTEERCECGMPAQAPAHPNTNGSCKTPPGSCVARTSGAQSAKLASAQELSLPQARRPEPRPWPTTLGRAREGRGSSTPIHLREAFLPPPEPTLSRLAELAVFRI